MKLNVPLGRVTCHSTTSYLLTNYILVNYVLCTESTHGQIRLKRKNFKHGISSRVFRYNQYLTDNWSFQRRKVSVVWPRSGSANSFTLTSAEMVISVLLPGVIRMNCRPIDRLAATI